MMFMWKWCRRFTVGACLVGVLPLVVGAASSTSGSSSAVPTTIDAEKMTVRNQDRRAIFEKKVVLKKGSLVVRSDLMEVFYQLETPSGSGRPSRSPSRGRSSGISGRSVDKIEATGTVKIEKENVRATCRKAVYFQNEEKIVLTGNPVAWQEGNRVSGRKITMFLAEDRIVVEGESRVFLEDESLGAP